METIEAAAIWWRGVCYTLPRPARHHDITRMMVEKHALPIEAQRHQGFVTNTGRYVGREQACRIATNAGQIKQKTNPKNKLFSEDVW